MDEKFFISIIDKFNASNIAELDFNDGNTRLTLRKEPGLQSPDVKTGTAQHAASEEHSVRLGIAANTAGETIKSPIVATFYASPNPDAPAFVKPGSNIKTGQTLCILEAMKMMNHLEAEFDCEIIEIHASNGELVEYGQDLFTVRRN